jgi:hypothetical protein
LPGRHAPPFRVLAVGFIAIPQTPLRSSTFAPLRRFVSLLEAEHRMVVIRVEDWVSADYLGRVVLHSGRVKDEDLFGLGVSAL